MTLIAFLPVLLRLSAQRHRSADHRRRYRMRWSSSRSSGRLFGTAVPGAGRHQAAGPRVPQPACRGGLPQGAGLWRGQCQPRRSADGRRAVRQRAAQLLPALFPLHVFQCRPHLLPADRQHLSLHHSGPDHRRWKDHARRHEPDPQLRSSQVRSARSSIWSIHGRRSSSCCRSTSACARSRRRSTASRCRISTGATWSGRRPTPSSRRDASWSAADAGRAGRRRAARCGRGSRGS